VTSLGKSAGDSEPEYPTAQLLDLVRRFDGSSRLDRAKRAKHVLGFDGGDGEGADDWEDVCFKPSCVLFLRAGGSACRSLG
jgi:hypothetical protein